MSTPTLMPAQPPSKKRKVKPLLTSADFLHWIQPGVFADLIAGEVYRRPRVNLRHATLMNHLDHVLRYYLEARDLGGVLFRETVAVELSVRDTFLPDLSYFTQSQASRLGVSHAAFAPMFVVEALSPATAKRDRGLKFAAYERHGVQEYWVLDPDGLDHKFYRRAGDLLEEFAAGADKVESCSIPGFWVRRSWLDPEKPLKVKACLKELMRRSKKD